MRTSASGRSAIGPRSSRPAACRPPAARAGAGGRGARALPRRRRGRDARDVYPALARVRSGALRHLRRRHRAATSTRPATPTAEFTIMSVAKPFVFALVCEALGPDEVRRPHRRQRHRAAVRLARGGRAQRATAGRTRWSTPGAIATTSLVPGATPRRSGGSSATASRASPAGRSRSTTTSTARPRETNHRNRGIARLLQRSRPHRRRPARGARPLHAPELPRRDRQGPRRDGRHARRRRRQPGHRRAGGRRRRPAGTRSR